jgi:parallel beta-helix repeat protein
MTRFFLGFLFILGATAATAANLPNISLYSNDIYGQRLDPGTDYPYRISLSNYGTDAHDLRVTIDVDPAATVIALQGDSVACSQNGTRIVCSAATFVHEQQGEIDFTVRTPLRRSGGRVTLGAELTIAEQMEAEARTRLSFDIILNRLIAVTSTADDGIGTLRDAIRDANVSCSQAQPCRVIFNLEPLQLTNGVATIRPETPLPVIKATVVTIDGKSQTDFAGDTNPAGPEVELSGAKLTSGHGLEFRADDRCDFTASIYAHNVYVSGLIINGFPGAGIVSSLPDRCFYAPYFGASGNYLGTDATGTRAIPNERGVMALGMIPTIFGNVVGGNRRSGVFIWNAIGAHVEDNHIGVGADDETPLGNGASGIFIENESGNSLVARNTIANNGEFGVAIAGSRKPSVTANSIHDNGLLGIDIGLDLVVPANVPKLTAAKYDPVTNTTVISGRVDVGESGIGCCNSFSVNLYASNATNPRGLAQAERSIGSVQSPSGAHFDFTFVANGDLTGQWITAQTQRTFITDFDTQSFETTELSNPVQATR